MSSEGPLPLIVSSPSGAGKTTLTARLLKEIAQGAFLEWAEVHGNLYGTGKAELERGERPRGIIFDIDHQGARQIKSAAPDSVAVFILPPSMAILEQRLRGRASEDEDTVQKRFGVALREIEHYGLFDYVLVNEELEEATKQLVSIFRAEECRRHRAARHAERLLAEGRGFGGSKPPSLGGGFLPSASAERVSSDPLK